MYYSDAIIGATHYSFITTKAVDYALKKGSRFLSFPMHTNDNSSIFEREFIRMSPKVANRMGKPLAEKITKADIVVVKTKKGTNVAFGIAGRRAGIFAGSCTKRGRVASYMALEDIKRGLEAAISAIDKNFDADINVNGGKEF